jgi:hypothetical protein
MDSRCFWPPAGGGPRDGSSESRQGRRINKGKLWAWRDYGKCERAAAGADTHTHITCAVHLAMVFSVVKQKASTKACTCLLSDPLPATRHPDTPLT